MEMVDVLIGLSKEKAYREGLRAELAAMMPNRFNAQKRLDRIEAIASSGRMIETFEARLKELGA